MPIADEISHDARVRQIASSEISLSHLTNTFSPITAPMPYRSANNNITSASKTNYSQQHKQPTTLSRLPFSNRYKSSPCLVGSTRSSKYSIYGGLRKPNDSGKPVPRLSYSRAIGPRLHRHVENQPKPSRYLKMK